MALKNIPVESLFPAVEDMMRGVAVPPHPCSRKTTKGAHFREVSSRTERVHSLWKCNPFSAQYLCLGICLFLNNNKKVEKLIPFHSWNIFVLKVERKVKRERMRGARGGATG